jgi:heme exporter protein C
MGGLAVSHREMKLLKLLLLPYIAAVIAGAFLWVQPAEGFIGESSRIVFFHVPCAWTATLAFLVAAAYSLFYLRSRNPRSDRIALAAVRLGLLFSVLTLVTGSLFAKIMWGSYWNWDPRESSYLLLVLLYGAYLFLRASIDDPERRARIAAAYALFSAVLMPFLVFVAPRITESLHPQTIVNPQGKILMDTPTKTIFFAGLIGFSAIFFWLLQLESRIAAQEKPGGR